MHGGLAMPALGTVTALEPQRKGWKSAGQVLWERGGSSKILDK